MGEKVKRAMELKQINKNIRLIAVNGAKLDNLVQTTAVGCMSHALEHGDVRPMDSLLNALNNGYRKRGFQVWVQTYSPIRWNGDGKIGLAKPDTKLYRPFNVDEANANPFWTLDAAAEKTVKELSAEALRAMISRFVKYVDEADENGDVHDKAGNVVKHVKGNVVELKNFATRIQAEAAKAA